MVNISLLATGAETTIGGVRFADVDNVNSGTGQYSTFLKLQGPNATGLEGGFNTVPGPTATNPDIDNAFTHLVQIGSMPIKVFGGVEYYEMRIDLNEPNNPNTQPISLDTFKIFTSTRNDIIAKPDLFTQTLRYDMDAGGDVSLLLSEANSPGSGNDNYAVLIPTALFAGALRTDYFYLYVELGGVQPGYDANAGFEEFNLQGAGSISGLKFFDDNYDGVRQANGRDGVAGTADDEVGLGGVTIFLDDDLDGVLDTNERRTTTDANGAYAFDGVLVGTHRVVEIIPTGYERTTGDYETVVIGAPATPGALGPEVIVDPIGNWRERPDFTVTKSGVITSGDTDNNGKIDTAGGIITYLITATNTGNIALADFVLIDANATLGTRTGDDGDGLFEVGETWTWANATHVVSQAELDARGTSATGAFDGDFDVDNTATGTAHGLTRSGTATTGLDYYTGLDVEKGVATTAAGPYADADTAPGLTPVLGGPVYFEIVVTNTGKITLGPVSLSDVLVNTTNNTTSPIDLSAYSLIESGTIDGLLAPGETARLVYSLPFEAGQHTNTVTASASTALGTLLSDIDSANYFGVVSTGPGVRTPGFWSNLGYAFWDGKVGLPKQAGQPGFADAEIPLDVVGGVKGLLIGFGGDTIFIKLTDAQQLIDASAKTAKSDGLQILGRDLVATWLNYKVGNPVEQAGDTDAANSAKHYIQDAVDWLQKYGDANLDKIFDFNNNNPVKTSSGAWASAGGGLDHSGSAIHTSLDTFNNTGMTHMGGTIYANNAHDGAYLTAAATLAMTI